MRFRVLRARLSMSDVRVQSCNLRDYTFIMSNEFTAVIERDGEWFIGWSPEIPGANGQGRSIEECREDLSQAIALILQDRREDGLRGVPDEAIRDVVRVA